MAHRSHRARRIATLPLLAALALVALVLMPARPAAAATTVTLVQTINTGAWHPSSPDPSGISYWPARDRLVIVDGEVDEMAIFQGVNVFVSTRGGSLTDTGNTMRFSREPVGIDIEVNSANGHFFISEDSGRIIYEVDLGPDGRIGGNDDIVRSFSTNVFGNGDPEGLTLGQIGGQLRLFTVDGAGKEVYISNPGPNGVFDGGGDDTVTWFSVAGIGVGDPEGIDYNPATGNLFIADRKNRQIVEITTAGALVSTIDLRPFGAINPGDLTLAPGSQNTSVMNLYVVDRGVDNNDDPNENDGKIYEISVDKTAPPNGNLLVNPGFESANGSNQPTAWSTGAGFTRSADAFHEGGFSGRFASASEASITIKQALSGLSGGTTYNVSSWVNIPTTADAFKFQLRVKWFNASNGVLRLDTYATFTDDTAGAWVQQNAALVAPAGTTKAQVLLVATKLSATIYVDEMSLAQ